jgi:hypothetical protein
MVKNIYIYLKYCKYFICKDCAVEDAWVTDPEYLWWFAPCLCSSVYSNNGTPSLKLRISVWFTVHLRDGWSLNLRAIENCIFCLCSIEHKMRSIFGQSLCLRDKLMKECDGLGPWISLYAYNPSLFYTPNPLRRMWQKSIDGQNAKKWNRLILRRM